MIKEKEYNFTYQDMLDFTLWCYTFSHYKKGVWRFNTVEIRRGYFSLDEMMEIWLEDKYLNENVSN